MSISSIPLFVSVKCNVQFLDLQLRNQSYPNCRILEVVHHVEGDVNKETADSRDLIIVRMKLLVVA